MRILEMVEEIEEQAEAAGGCELIAPPGWRAAATPDADLHWRAAPHPITGGLFQDPDFTYPTAAGPLAFRLFYYSGNAATASEYGSGRRASWPLRLTSDGTTVTVMHDDGVDRQYRNDGTNHFAVIGPPSGDTLTYDAVNGWDETRGDTGYKFHFPVGNYVSLAYRETPQGLYVTCTYDSSQRLQSLTEPAGRQLTFSYNTDGRVQLVQDWGYRQDTVLTYVGTDLTEVWEPNGAVTQYRYDSSHRMTAVYDPVGYGTTYTYDYASRVLSRSVAGNLGVYTYVTSGPTLETGYTDPNGNTWTHLSSGGIPTGQIDPLGNTQTYLYQNCRPVAITNALGYTTTYSYDIYGFQTGRQDALGNRWTYTRDASAHVILTAQDPLGYVTTYAWGASPTLRQLQGITDPLGNATTIGYLSNGLPQYREDPLGNIRTYTWSGQALLTAETNPLGYATSYQYDAGTNRIGITDSLGNQWTYGFDIMRRQVIAESPNGAVSTTLFDARGKAQVVIDPLGSRTTHVWNAYGESTAVVDPLGAYRTTVYDGKGTSLAVIDALGRRTSHLYDAADRRLASVDPAGVRRTTVYDGVGQAIARVDPIGVRSTTAYDPGGRAVSVTNPLGLISTTAYDTVGRPVATTLPTGAISTTTYDAVGQAVAVLDAFGYRWTSVWDAVGGLIANVDPLANRASTIYDATGSAVATVAPDGGTTTVIYDPAQRPVASVDPLGFRTTTVYDAAGQAVGTVDPLGFRSTRIYDVAGRQVGAMDALGFQTTSVYDPAGRANARVDAQGQRWTSVYDASGAVIALVDALGYTNTSVFDAAGRVVSRVDALGGMRTVAYDGYGRPAQAVDPRGYVTSVVYDAFGREVGRRDPLGYLYTLTFDGFGRYIGTVDQLGFQTTMILDLLDRPAARLDALGYRTTTLYDAAGNTLATIDALGRRSTNLYDSATRLVAKTNALGYRQTTTYDLRGSQIATTNPMGYRTTTVFDALARAQATVDALGRRTTLSYDARGSIAQRTDAKAQVETRTYDALGRYSGSQFADATRVTIGYSPVSQVTQMANQLGAYTRAYDPVGRQVSEIGPSYPNGMPLTSVYDPAGSRTGLITWRGTQTSTFDARSQLTLLQDIEGGRTTWAYDARQMNTQQQNPNGTSTNIAYDADGRCLTIRHLHPAGNWLDSALYSYDAVGNPLSLNREDGDPYSYAYDNANQLLVQSSPSEGTKTWTYDPAGNRITELSNPGTSIPATSYWITCTFDAADQQLTEQKTGSEIGSSSNSTFSYDLNGNRILESKVSGAVTSYATYSWDPSNRLSVVQDRSYVMTNTYRPDGMRHQRADNYGTEVMVWDKNDTLAWVDQTGALGEFFSRGAKAVKGYTSPSPTGELFYHCTALGTMQAYSNPDGTTKERIALDAWGGNATSMGVDVWSFVGDLGYWGEVALSRPLYYVRARWLAAGGPGWLSRDPLPGQRPYSYVGNWPTRLVDPRGLSSDPAPGVPNTIRICVSTFIPSDHVKVNLRPGLPPALLLLSETIALGQGDNRSYSPNSDSFRTNHDITLYLDGREPSWRTRDQGGVSQIPSLGVNLQANGLTLRTEATEMTTDKWLIWVHGDEANAVLQNVPPAPFLQRLGISLGLTITYDLFIVVTPDGAWVWGDHDGYPAYEVWQYKGTGTKLPVSPKWGYTPPCSRDVYDLLPPPEVTTPFMPIPGVSWQMIEDAQVELLSRPSPKMPAPGELPFIPDVLSWEPFVGISIEALKEALREFFHLS